MKICSQLHPIGCSQPQLDLRFCLLNNKLIMLKRCGLVTSALKKGALPFSLMGPKLRGFGQRLYVI